jgi:pimeloyl-ACP methyl ester carboxylesterase
MIRRRWIVAAATAGAVAVSAGLAVSAGSLPARSGAVPALEWGSCPPAPKGSASTEGFQCASAAVPVDYSELGGGTFSLALIRYPARDQGGRLGTVFWNPGGPSDAGTQYLPAAIEGFPEQVRERFDIVSWDPRGMGGRTRPVVQCFANASQERRFLSRHTGPAIPASVRELRAYIRRQTQLHQRCVRRNGDLLEHVSTADNARDLDLLRQAVGDERLTYYGTSYGTFLGTTYINMFPDKVRAAVLDGAVAPRAWAGANPDARKLTTFLRVRSDIGSRDTVAEFMRRCGAARRENCAFSSGTPQSTVRKYSKLLDRLKSSPVTIKGQPLDDRAARAYVQGSIYLLRPLPGFDRFPGWSAVAQFLEQAWRATKARSRGSASRAGVAARPAAAQHASTYITSAGRQLSVVCGESPNPTSLAGNVAQARASYRRAGLNSWPFVAMCRGWTARASDRYLGPWNRPTPAPVLVIGNTYDPATPYSSSRRMANSLAAGRLLTVEGFGHTVLLNPSRCAQDRVASYMINGSSRLSARAAGRTIPRSRDSR